MVTPYQGTTALAPVTTTTSPVTVTGLISSSTYTFSVAATNTNGTGAAATSSPVTTAITACPVAGATDVWTGAAGTTSWTTANNWSASHQPFSTDVACLPAGTFGATSISVPSTTVKQLISYKPLTIASGLTTTNGADFEADATWTGGIFVGPSMMIGSGSTITINGQITLFGSLAVTNAGTVQIVNGTYPIGVSQSCGTGNTASWTNTGTLAFADPGSTAMSLCSGSFTNAVGGIIIHTGAGTDYISSAEISDAGNILSPIGVLVLSTNAGSLTGGTIGGGAGQVVLSGTVSTTSSVIVADNVWVVGTLTGSTVVPAGATLHVGFDANYQVGYASSITGSVNGAGSLSVAGHYYSSIYGPGTTSIATIAADINVPAMTLGDYTAFATKPDGTPTVIGSGTAVNVAGAVTLTGSVAVVNSGAITVSQGYHSANPSNLSGGLSSPCNVPDTPALTNNGSITFTDPYGSASISLCTGSITNTNSGTLGHTASGTDTISAYQLTNAGTVTSQAGVLVWSSPNGQITGGQFAGTPGQIVINGTSTVSSSATVGDNVWVVGTLTGTTTVPAGATLHVGYDAQYQTNVNNSAGIIAGSVNGAGSLSVAGFYYASIYGPGTQSTATVAADLNVASVTMGDYTTFAAKTDGTSLQIGGGTVLNTAGDVTMTGSVAVVNNGTVNVTLGYHAANPYNLSGGIYSPCNVPDTPSWTNGGILNFTDPYGNAAVSLCTGIITNSGFIGHTAPATDSLSAAQLISTGTVTSQAGVLVWSSPNGQLNGGQVSGSTGQVVLAGTTTATVSAVVGDNVWVIGTLGGSTVVPAGATLHVGYDAKYPYSGANAGTISGTVSGAGTLSAAGFYYTSIYGQGTRSTATIAADLNVNTVTLGDYTTFADKPDGSGPQIGSGTNVTVAGDVTLTGSVALVNNGTINVTLGYHAANPYNLNGGIYSPCNVPDTPSLTNAGTLTFTDTGQAAVSLCTGTLTNSGTVGHSGTSTDTITATQLVTTGSIQPQVGVLVWSSTNSSVSGGSVGNGIGQIVLTGTITATNAAAIGDNTWVVNGTLGGTTVISAGATLHVGYDPNYQYNFNGPEGTVTGNVTGAGTLSAVGHYYNNYPFGSNTANAIVAADLNVTNVTLDAYTTLGIKPDSTPTAIDSGTTVTLVTTPTLASNLVLNNAGTIDFHTNGYFTCTTCTVTNQQGGNFIVYNPDGSFTHGFVINAGTFDNEGTIKLTGYMPGTWVVAGPNVTLPNVGLGNGETDGLRQPSWIQNLQTNSTLNQIASSLTQSGGLYSLGNKAIMYAVAALKNIGVGQCVNVNVSLGVPGSSVGLCLVVDPAGNESVAVSVSGGFSGDVSYPPSQNWDASKLLKEPEYSIDAGAMVLWKADPVNGQGFNAYTDLDGLSVCQNGALVSPDFIGVTGQHCWGPEDGVQFKLGILSTNQPGVHSGYVGVVVGTPGATTGMVLSYSVTLSCAQWYSATGQACPPVNATPPSISGTTSVGSTLQVDTGQWTTPDPSQPLTYRYQWGRCTSSSASSCYQISGATSNTYTATDADRNYYLTVWVTATNASGTSQAVAATPVGPVQ